MLREEASNGLGRKGRQVRVKKGRGGKEKEARDALKVKERQGKGQGN